MVLLPYYIFVVVVSVAVSLALVPVFRRLSFRLGVLDLPGPRKSHTEPMPLLGGAAVYCAFTVVVVGAAAASGIFAEQVRALLPYEAESMVLGVERVTDPLVTILLCGTAIALLGLADDAWHLSAMMRLAIQTLVAIVVVNHGIRPVFFGLDPLVVDVVAVVWIVGITNSFNLLDGMDGISAGVGAIAGAILATYSAMNGEPMIASFLLVLVGTLLGFLRYNFLPARVYLGSSGSMFIGFNLSVIVLLAGFMTGASRSIAPVVMPVLILGVPLYDTISVVLIRLRQGRSPIAPDRNHLFHRLRRTGLTDKQVVLFVYLLTFCVGVNATLLGGATIAESVVILIQILATFGLIVLLERIHLLRAGIVRNVTLPAELRIEGGEPIRGLVVEMSGARVKFEATSIDAVRAAAWIGRAGFTLHLAGSDRVVPFVVDARVRGVEAESRGGVSLDLVVGSKAPDAEERLRDLAAEGGRR